MWLQCKGRVLNILSSSVQSTETTRLYSAVIRGLGSFHGLAQGMLAAEWLTWQILCEAAHILQNDGDIKAFEEAGNNSASPQNVCHLS